MNIVGKKTILRAIEFEDCNILKKMFNDPEMENSVVGWCLPLSSYSNEEWFKKHNSDSNSFRLIIENESNIPIGVLSVVGIDWKNRTASYGIKLIKEYQKNGYGYDSLTAILRYLFEELNLHRIETSILSYNLASIKLIEKCGGLFEGIKREAVYKNGNYQDIKIYGILKKDYLLLKQ